MIELKGVSKRWKNFRIKNVDLSVKEGEYFVILGPSGAGKTLLLELIAGFHFPDEGRIFIDGRDMTFSPPEERGIGFIYQDYMLFPHLTVEGNIAFGLRAKFRCWRWRRQRCERLNERVREVLQLLGIEHLRWRYPETLSGGERQKVAIARALAIEPKILLLDEPLSALDMPTRDRLRDDLKILNRKKCITMIHVTHDRTEAAMLSDRIAVMMRGEIVQVGTPREIFSKPANAEIAEFVGIENILRGTIVNNRRGIAEIEVSPASPKNAATAEEATEAKLHIFAPSKYDSGTAVNLFIRPEDIVLLKSVHGKIECAGELSARNVIRSEIASITPAGSGIFSVRLRNGLVALLTANAFEELGLKEGDEVFAIFKATAVHTVTSVQAREAKTLPQNHL